MADIDTESLPVPEEAPEEVSDEELARVVAPSPDEGIEGLPA